MSAVSPSDYLNVVAAMSTLALILWLLYASARAVARWARARGRRPWLWVLTLYVAVNVVIGIAQVLVGRGPR